MEVEDPLATSLDPKITYSNGLSLLGALGNSEIRKSSARETAAAASAVSAADVAMDNCIHILHTSRAQSNEMLSEKIKRANLVRTHSMNRRTQNESREDPVGRADHSRIEEKTNNEEIADENETLDDNLTPEEETNGSTTKRDSKSKVLRGPAPPRGSGGQTLPSSLPLEPDFSAGKKVFRDLLADADDDSDEDDEEDMSSKLKSFMGGAAVMAHRPSESSMLVHTGQEDNKNDLLPPDEELGHDKLLLTEKLSTRPMGMQRALSERSLSRSGSAMKRGDSQGKGSGLLAGGLARPKPISNRAFTTGQQNRRAAIVAGERLLGLPPRRTRSPGDKEKAGNQDLPKRPELARTFSADDVQARFAGLSLPRRGHRPSKEERNELYQPALLRNFSSDDVQAKFLQGGNPPAIKKPQRPEEGNDLLPMPTNLARNLSADDVSQRVTGLLKSLSRRGLLSKTASYRKVKDEESTVEPSPVDTTSMPEMKRESSMGATGEATNDNDADTNSSPRRERPLSRNNSRSNLSRSVERKPVSLLDAALEKTKMRRNLSGGDVDHEPVARISAPGRLRRKDDLEFPSEHARKRGSRSPDKTGVASRGPLRGRSSSNSSDDEHRPTMTKALSERNMTSRSCARPRCNVLDNMTDNQNDVGQDLETPSAHRRRIPRAERSPDARRSEDTEVALAKPTIIRRCQSDKDRQRRPEGECKRSSGAKTGGKRREPGEEKDSEVAKCADCRERRHRRREDKNADIEDRCEKHRRKSRRGDEEKERSSGSKSPRRPREDVDAEASKCADCRERREKKREDNNSDIEDRCEKHRRKHRRKPGEEEKPDKDRSPVEKGVRRVRSSRDEGDRRSPRRRHEEERSADDSPNGRSRHAKEQGEHRKPRRSHEADGDTSPGDESPPRSRPSKGDRDRPGGRRVRKHGDARSRSHSPARTRTHRAKATGARHHQDDIARNQFANMVNYYGNADDVEAKDASAELEEEVGVVETVETSETQEEGAKKLGLFSTFGAVTKLGAKVVSKTASTTVGVGAMVVSKTASTTVGAGKLAANVGLATTVGAAKLAASAASEGVKLTGQMASEGVKLTGQMASEGVKLTGHMADVVGLGQSSHHLRIIPVSTGESLLTPTVNPAREKRTHQPVQSISELQGGALGGSSYDDDDEDEFAG